MFSKIFLKKNNPYVKIYMQACEHLRKSPGDALNIVLKANNSKDKTKNTPTSNLIAVLMVNNDQFELNKRDVIV